MKYYIMKLILWYLAKNKIALYTHTLFGRKRICNFHEGQDVTWKVYTFKQHETDKRNLVLSQAEETLYIDTLTYLYHRLVEVHNENPYYDYMIRMRKILKIKDPT